MKTILKFFIRIYQRFVSPLFPSSCRYHPTCSGYAMEAIEKHGAFKGSILSIKRLMRCHPFTKQKSIEIDEVPKKQ